MISEFCLFFLGRITKECDAANNLRPESFLYGFFMLGLHYWSSPGATPTFFREKMTTP